MEGGRKKKGNLRRSSEVGRNGKEHKKWKNKKQEQNSEVWNGEDRILERQRRDIGGMEVIEHLIFKEIPPKHHDNDNHHQNHYKTISIKQPPQIINHHDI